MENYIVMMCMFITNVETTLEICKPFILLVLKLLSYNTHIIYNRQKIIQFRKYLRKDYTSSSIIDIDKCDGIIIPNNRKFISYLNERLGILYIISKKHIIKEIFEDEEKPKIEMINIDEKEIEEKTNNIEYWYRNGDYNYFDYSKKRMFIKNVSFKPQQNIIYENIMKIYNEKNNVTSYIYGDIGIGKTFLCYLMACKLNCYLCDSFNPCDPGDNFMNLYNIINPTAKKPLILVLDEVDILISKIHNQDIIQHKNSPTQVCNKTTWNNMLDKIDYGLYPNVIFILCSNKKPYEINRLDDSYLRQGRIDLLQHLIKE